MEDASYLHEDEEERTVKQRLKDYCVNDGPKLVFILLYIGANIALFLGMKRSEKCSSFVASWKRSSVLIFRDDATLKIFCF